MERDGQSNHPMKGVWIVEVLPSHQRVSGDFLQMGGTHIWRDQKEDKSNFKGQNIYFWTHIVSFQQSLWSWNICHLSKKQGTWNWHCWCLFEVLLPSPFSPLQTVVSCSGVSASGPTCLLSQRRSRRNKNFIIFQNYFLDFEYFSLTGGVGLVWFESDLEHKYVFVQVIWATPKFNCLAITIINQKTQLQNC